MKKLVGKVTEDEKDCILSLFERKNGLAELSHLIGSDDLLYEKLVLDMGRTGIEFQKWWDSMAEKYKWESILGMSWSIDFDTCEIFLTDGNN